MMRKRSTVTHFDRFIIDTDNHNLVLFKNKREKQFGCFFSSDKIHIKKEKTTANTSNYVWKWIHLLRESEFIAFVVIFHLVIEMRFVLFVLILSWNFRFRSVHVVFEWPMACMVLVASRVECVRFQENDLITIEPIFGILMIGLVEIFFCVDGVYGTCQMKCLSTFHFGGR